MDAANVTGRTFLVIQPGETGNGNDIAIAIAAERPAPAPHVSAAAALRKRMQIAGVTGGKVLGGALGVTGASGCAVSSFFALQGLAEAVIDEVHNQQSFHIEKGDMHTRTALAKLGLCYVGLGIGAALTATGVMIAKSRWAASREPVSLPTLAQTPFPITEVTLPQSAISSDVAEVELTRIDVENPRVGA